MALKAFVTSYNNGPWARRCLESIASQGDYDAIVIDDLSDDGSTKYLERMCARLGWTFVRNEEENYGKCRNLWEHLPKLELKRDDIIFIVDGDDFLPRSDIFEYMEHVYRDRSVWLTYGSYEPYPRNTGQLPARPYPPNVMQARTYREIGVGNLFNHPLTFRYHVWQDCIQEADLRSAQGVWFTGGEDLVIMCPMLEHCTPLVGVDEVPAVHWRYLDRVLYAYNSVNPLSESNCKVDKIIESREVHHRPKKDPA